MTVGKPEPAQRRKSFRPPPMSTWRPFGDAAVGTAADAAIVPPATAATSSTVASAPPALDPARVTLRTLRGSDARSVDRRHPMWVMSYGAGRAYVGALVRFLRVASRGLGPDRSRRSRPVRHPGALLRPDGAVVDWDSREHRKQAGRLDAGRGSTWWAPTAVGWWIGVLFAIGSVCFTVGALPGYVDWVGTDADAITFFVGSIFFTTAAYLQFVQTVNAPARAARPGTAAIGSASGPGSRAASTGRRAACSSSAPSSSTSRPSPPSTPASTRPRPTASCGCPTWSDRSASSSPAASRGSR